ncbi:MAG: hypothetical protein COT71_02540 [Candidatus Andersenbacteria bacterium CG10_big_fil_rev_8_21_14_0_10_54_11]|uniref:Glycosyl transferase family 1 domain-containing protein n=1 Tax=Candidatus Andersenbacteria bacterium CG10_big_fil_rev_8_21_14_0_10_54_11 TaxID=1974485 RepID=A0A2M6WZB4_9BACT|nr:MAG: hypothetical protein COT71_02540 [Candidatus Andersenbacteria bacterium CG10_big_fil_rev_8_21_14_0_10_54_11]
MKRPAAYLKLHNHLALKLAKKKLVTVRMHGATSAARVLVYYKSDPFTRGYLHDHRHTNIWEVRTMVGILNRLGFTVDVLDRTGAAAFVAKHPYQVFIGLGSDDSGQHFPRIAQQLPKAVRIMYATCMEPASRNAAVLDRYQSFNARHGRMLPPRRLVRHLDADAVRRYADFIFYIGNDNTRATYNRYEKPTLRIFPSTTPKLRLTARSLDPARKNRFLFFSGTGNILKGLDLALEAFAQLPQYTLYICTQIEPDFAHFYKQLLHRTPNIRTEGIVSPLGRRFQQLTEQCGYALLPSAAEGTTTSVATCMRRGLVPVVTPNSGLDIRPFGQEIAAGTVAGVVDACRAAAGRSDEAFRTAVRQTYRASFAYTQESFVASFTDALLQVCEQKRLLMTPPHAITL